MNERVFYHTVADRFYYRTIKDIPEQFRIQSLTDLHTLPDIDKIRHWDEYVAIYNTEQTMVETYDDSVVTFTCYLCGQYFEKIPKINQEEIDQYTADDYSDDYDEKQKELQARIEKQKASRPYRVLFRYKPHKTNWRDEDVCTVCFHAAQNPKFPFHESQYGYEGILIPCEGEEGEKDGEERNGGYYKDLRDCALEADRYYENYGDAYPDEVEMCNPFVERKKK